ncbi:MAG: tRNA adenosine(34) deaminase TadA [Desulfobacterales bacterium]|jgi:tRNA(adenine34) deaminase|nr:tRNA adenosine(34) deaminase TadA [Desulfobacteraceae bacterium]MDY0312787.1 tRNA adenosine(34) deaminase TadA [Desulfobacterales bacterium]
MNGDDHRYMRQALAEAEKAGQRGEVPVGAVLVAEDGTVLAADGNRTIELADPSAHAEMLVMRAAAAKLNNYRLPGTTLYATVEPCIMCLGAAVHARIARVVFGAPDPKWGAAGSMYNFCTDSRLNHCIETTAGVLADECRELIQAFFRERR